MATEWGRINDGAPFHVLTVDLDRAIAHLGLSRYESMLLQYVREHSWGVAVRQKRRGEPWPDPLPVEINITAMAKEWGVPRQRLNEARWSLANRNVLIDEDGRLSINKCASTWIGLSPQSHAYAQKQPSIGGTPQRSTDKETPTENRTPQRSGGERPSVQGVNAPAFSPTNTDRTRVPEEIQKNPEEGGRTPAPDPVKAPVPDPEVVRVAKLMDRLDPYANGGWAQKVHQFAAMYPPAWILAAGEAAAAAGKGDWRYVHRILQRFQQQGGPDAAPTPRLSVVSDPGPPLPPKYVPEPEPTPEERAENTRRLRAIQAAVRAGVALAN